MKCLAQDGHIRVESYVIGIVILISQVSASLLCLPEDSGYLLATTPWGAKYLKKKKKWAQDFREKFVKSDGSGSQLMT